MYTSIMQFKIYRWICLVKGFLTQKSIQQKCFKQYPSLITKQT